MEREIFLTSIEINGKANGYKRVRIDLIGFTEIYHVAHQSLFVRELPMILKMIEAVTLLAQQMKFE